MKYMKGACKVVCDPDDGKLYLCGMDGKILRYQVSLTLEDGFDHFPTAVVRLEVDLSELEGNIDGRRC